MCIFVIFTEMSIIKSLLYQFPAVVVAGNYFLYDEKRPAIRDGRLCVRRSIQRTPLTLIKPLKRAYLVIGTDGRQIYRMIIAARRGRVVSNARQNVHGYRNDETVCSNTSPSLRKISSSSSSSSLKARGEGRGRVYIKYTERRLPTRSMRGE